MFTAVAGTTELLKRAKRLRGRLTILLYSKLLVQWHTVMLTTIAQVLFFAEILTTTSSFASAFETRFQRIKNSQKQNKNNIILKTEH